MTPDQTRAVVHLADAAAELVSIARNSDLNSVAYLLDIARMEAAKIAEAARTGTPQPDEREAGPRASE